MILNNSRAEQFNTCKQLAYNQDELGLAPHRTAQALLVGSGFHAGKVAINQKQGDLESAADAAEQEYMLRANWADLLPEEKKLAQADINLVRSMVKAYGEYYINENYELLASEVKFCTPLPNTEHHCYYFHKLLVKLGQASEENQLECKDPRCWQPHYLTGTTDAVIQWNRLVWLQEHKTTAYDLYNDSPQSKNWIRNWYLSTQASTYIYGIWKSLGVRPHGVLLNVVIKPRKNAANPQFKFYREAFLRTEEQLARFEKNVSLLADDYEYRMRTGAVWQDPSGCFKYNRQCDFHNSCVTGEVRQGEFRQREPDYVNAAYYKILGLEPPAHKESEENNETTTSS